jgi:homoserine O-acetyltransferase
MDDVIHRIEPSRETGAALPQARPRSEAALPDGGGLRRRTAVARFDEPLALEGGASLPSFEIAYETYGDLDANGGNAILVCHGLTADQRVAAADPSDRKPGWWQSAVGPGAALDTDRYFVVSANVLGGFGGTSAPASIDPQTGRPYGLRFPIVTIGDMVQAQAKLAGRLGIDRFHAVVGGCMGGFLTLEWMVRFPDRVRNAIVISATARTSTHNVALWEVMREAIRRDPNWRNGDYYDGEPPRSGLALLAMFGALYWMDRATLAQRFGLRRIAGQEPTFSFAPEFEIEAFLHRIGGNVSDRLDANALLYLTRAIDYFDLTRGKQSLSQALAGARARTLLVSYRADWRYPSEEMEEINQALRAHGLSCRHVTLDSPFGHGGFLYDFSSLDPVIREFLATAEPGASGQASDAKRAAAPDMR